MPSESSASAAPREELRQLTLLSLLLMIVAAALSLCAIGYIAITHVTPARVQDSPRRLLLIAPPLAWAFAQAWLLRRLIADDGRGFERLLALSCRWTARPWVALLVALAIVEAHFLALTAGSQQAVLHHGPVLKVLTLWAYAQVVALSLGVLGCTLPGLRRLAPVLRPLALAAGLAVLGLAAVALLIQGNSALFSWRAPVATHRAENFPDPDLVGAFWRDYSELRAQWLPLSYYKRKPYQGAFHTVDMRGLRVTHSSGERTSGANLRVFFFGGSAAWGYGVRDAYTLPSLLSGKLREALSTAVEFTNFAESGYTSTQSLLLFMRQLQLGERPDLAVFYEGYNDVYAGVASGYAGVSISEGERVEDFEFGLHRNALWKPTSLVPQWPPTLALPRPNELRRIDDVSPGLQMGLVAKDGTPRHIVDIYLENMAVVRAIARQYGVEVLFVWQPNPYVRKPLTDAERVHAALFERIHPGIGGAFASAYQELTRRVERGTVSNFLDLGAVFETRREQVYFDFCHLTEQGNLAVAESLVGPISALLRRDRPEGKAQRTK